MPLDPSSRVGPYEIVSFIAAGGMGEVYRAHDTRLERDVAIKILTDRLALDSRSLSQFRIEAKAIAALSHPNILAIYDAGLEQPPLFLVMELLDGKTLRSMLESSLLPWRDVVELGTAVAEGLAAAHSAGVIHRDLKPENVFVTSKRAVKILDFGLAQFKRGFAASSGAMASTVSDVNIVMGTVGYMSPEQVRGEKLTPASDIFSLGCVLYEMLAGRGAFHRSTPAATIAAILSEQPRRVSGYSPLTPPELDRWIGHCLEKDPDRRPQSALDLAIVLRDLLDQNHHQPSVAAPLETTLPTTTGHPPKPAPIWKRAFLPGVLVSMAVGALLMGAFRMSQPDAHSEIPVRRFALALPVPTNLMGVPQLAISPNGKHIAIVAGEGLKKLWVQDLDKEQPRVIEGSDGATGPFWSPDSTTLGFAAGGKLRKISVSGGLPVTLCDLIGNFMGGGSWSPDGSSIVFSTGSPAALYSVPAAGGSARVLVSHKEINVTDGSPAPFGWLTQPHQVAHNNRRAVLFSYDASVLLYDLESRQTRVIGRGVRPSYSSTGHVIYKAGSDVWAQRFSLTDFRQAGEPFRVARSAADPSVASDGTLVYGDAAPEQLVWVDRRGARISALGEPAEGLYYPALSPKPGRIAFERLENGNQDVWVIDINRGTKARLSSHPASEVLPVWSPDGTQVAFSSYRAGNTDVFVRSADGSSDEIRMTAEPQNERASDWSPDGQYILCYETHPKTRADVWYLKRNATGGWDRAPFVNSASNEKIAKFSPDGRYVAYLSDESGRDELYVRQFPSGAARWPVSTGGALQVRWSRNGSELFYVEAGWLLAVSVRARDGFTIGSATRLFSHPAFTVALDANYDVSADGQRFLVPERVESGDPKIRVVQNWFGEFRDHR